MRGRGKFPEGGGTAAKSGNTFRRGNRKNCTAPASPPIDFDDGMKAPVRRQIPAVSRILDALESCDLPRPFMLDLIRRKLSENRANHEVADFETIVAGVRRSLDELRASRLQPVVNGTGIVIHTNFGRAPLASEAAGALVEISSAYSNLEYDLATGERGRRGGDRQNGAAVLFPTGGANRGK